MADMIQRAFGVASNDDIAAQWTIIESKFKGVAGEGGKLLKGNKEHSIAIQELAVEYKKYLDMGGKNDLSKLTTHKQTVKNITTEYEKLNTEVKETQDVLDNKGSMGAISHAEDQINKENKAIDDQISKVSKLIKGWKELNTEHALFFNSKTGINSGDISSGESQYISIKDDLFKGKGYDSIIHNHPKDFTESGLAFSDSDLLGLVEKAFKEGITNILLYYQDQIMKLDISGFSEEQVRSLGNIYQSFYRDFDETAQNSVVASDIFDDIESYLKSIKETLRFALGLDKEFSVTPDSENTFESLSKELLISIEENVFASIKGLITRSPELFNEKSYISLYEEVSNLILSDVEKNLTELISKESISLDSSKIKTFIDKIKALFGMERAFVLPEDLQVGKRARMGRASSVEEMNSALNSILKAIDPSSDRLSIHSIEEIFPQSFASKVSSEEKEAINAVSRENKKLETQAGKTGTALENEGKSAQSAAEKFRKLAKEKGAAVYANRELAKAAKETADALEREAKVRKETGTKTGKDAVNPDTYATEALKWRKGIEQSLLDGGTYEEVYGAKISQAANGVVTFKAYVKDLNGEWQILTATVDKFGNISSPKIQEATEKQVLSIEKAKLAWEKYVNAMASEGEEPTFFNRAELESYIQTILEAEESLEKFKIKKVEINSGGRLAITTEFKEAGGQVKTFVANFNSVDDIIDETTGSVKNLAQALESAFDFGKMMSTPNNIEALYAEIYSTAQKLANLDVDLSELNPVKDAKRIPKITAQYRELEETYSKLVEAFFKHPDFDNLTTGVVGDLNGIFEGSEKTKGIIELRQRYEELFEMAKKLANMDVKIAKLDSTKNANQIQELTDQYRELEKVYNSLATAFFKDENIGELPIGSIIEDLNVIFDNAKKQINEINAKIKDAQENLSRGFGAEAQDAFSKFELKHKNNSNWRQVADDVEKLRESIDSIDSQDKLNEFKQNLSDIVVRLNNIGKDNKLGNILGGERTFKDINEVRANIDSLFASMGKVNEKSIKITGTDKLTAEVKIANGEIRKMAVSLDSNSFARYVDKGIVEFGRLRSAAEGVFKGIKDMVRIYLSPSDFIRYFRQGFDAVKEIDTAMTELRKVSDASPGDITAYFDDAVESAKELGSSVNEMIGATADWQRMGMEYCPII